MTSGRLKTFYMVPLGAMILMIFALYNNYPIVSGDSTTYLDSGFLLKVPDERPIFYGLFLRATSLGVSLWLSCFAQSLLLSYVLIQFIKYLIPDIDNLKLLALQVLLSLGTILSWYAGQVMPDIFTAILFLAFANFLLQKADRKKQAIFLSIALLATLTHFSHYIITTLFSSVLLAGSFLATRFRQYRKKSWFLLGITAFAWMALYTSNFIAGKGFVSSNVSHVFLMGKLAESGVLKTYLDKACPTRDYKLCRYKDSLPPVAWEFVWDGNSPVFREGGWAANKAEYTAIIHDIASRPKYWPYLAFKSCEATARQLVATNIDEGEERAWVKFEREHPLYQCLQRYFPHEINEFAVSKQNTKIMDLFYFDHLYTFVLVLSTIVVLFLISQSTQQEAARVYFLLILFLVLNAFATATFGNVLGRLNSRTIWLLPAVNIIFIFRILLQRLYRTAPTGNA